LTGSDLRADSTEKAGHLINPRRGVVCDSKGVASNATPIFGNDDRFFPVSREEWDGVEAVPPIDGASAEMRETSGSGMDFCAIATHV